MLDAAQKRASELGIMNVDFRLLDAQAMDLPDASFDGAVCRWGFMLMPDPAAAFRETKRILAPGGRLAFAVFTSPGQKPIRVGAREDPQGDGPPAAAVRRRGRRGFSRLPIAHASSRWSRAQASRTSRSNRSP